MKIQKAFTLVEILIVVALLGILAAIVIPAFGNNMAVTKQSALAQELKILQRVILIYKAQHLEVAPGYPNGCVTCSPTEAAFVSQFTLASNSNGQTAAVGTAGYNRGPYLMRIPVNPVNNLSTVQMLGNSCDFPAHADNSHGWIYKPATGEIRPDCTGTDTNGKSYYSY